MTDSSQQTGRQFVGAMGASLGSTPQQPATAPAVATVAAPETSAPDLTAVQHQLDDMLARLGQLGERFDSKLAYDLTKQQQIDFLNDEVRKAREGLFLQILRPIFLSLIALHDIIGQGYAAVAPEPGATESATARNYRSYRDEIEEILARSGVNLYQSQAGASFDPTRHQARATQAIGDPARDKTIALSQRAGFEYQGKVLRPEWVVVSQYAAGTQG